MKELIYSDKYSGSDRAAFIQKVIEVSRRIGIDANWLMAVMWKESRLNPRAQNTAFLVEGKPATGLIQFVESTARELGTSTDALYNMSGVEQLDFVEKYFKRYKGRLNSYFDTYAAVFFPAAIGKPDSWIFETNRLSRSVIARSNPAVDLDSNGFITVGEFKKYLLGGFSAKVKKLLSAGANVLKGGGFWALVVMASLWFVVSKK